jgi:hypothetical protein
VSNVDFIVFNFTARLIKALGTEREYPNIVSKYSDQISKSGMVPDAYFYSAVINAFGKQV